MSKFLEMNVPRTILKTSSPAAQRASDSSNSHSHGISLEQTRYSKSFPRSPRSTLWTTRKMAVTMERIRERLSQNQSHPVLCSICPQNCASRFFTTPIRFLNRESTLRNLRGLLTSQRRSAPESQASPATRRLTQIMRRRHDCVIDAHRRQ